MYKLFLLGDLGQRMDRILVVDDEVTVSDFLKDFLTLKGYEVFTASDGYTALNK